MQNGPVESTEIKRIMAEYRIGEKTMNDAGTALGITRYRKMRKWYWAMPDADATLNTKQESVPENEMKDVKHE